MVPPGEDEVDVVAGGRPLRLPSGAPLHAALADAGLPVESPCGGRGRCGRCRVRFRAGAPAPSDADRVRLTPAELALGFRLACQHTAAPGQEIERVAHGLLAPGAAPDAAAARKAGLVPPPRPGDLPPYPVDPLVRKVRVTVPRPSGEAPAGDWERLGAALAAALASAPGPAAEGVPTPAGVPGDPPLALLRDLPGVLRAVGGAVTVLLGEGRVLAVEPGDTTGVLYGVAFDLGTTTLAASLVDLNTGEELAVASAPNPQAVHGADLMTRLGHAFTPEGRVDLRRRAVEALNALLDELRRRRGLAAADVYAAAVVGNTAMHHLFLGLEVEPLALAPYVPAVTGALVLTAPETGLDLNPAGLVYCPPLVGGFAGSDLAAVLLATRLWEREGPRLVVDLGTNGEILLGDREGVLACSAPAGPAFEGGAISAGMRAAPGAIQGVRIPREGDVVLDVIGGTAPAGICGSGLVSAVAEFLRVGVLDASGRFRSGPPAAGTAPAGSGFPEVLRRRLTAEGGGGFRLVEARAAAGGTAITLTQRDVRQLQLAKAAIRAGAEMLLARRGLAAGDLVEVLLAGTFGNYIGEEAAVAIGLLPPVDPERVRPVGNAAAAGARLALVSRPARAAMEAAVRRTEHVPLAALPEFQDIFLQATFFPVPAGSGGDAHGA